VEGIVFENAYKQIKEFPSLLCICNGGGTGMGPSETAERQGDAEDYVQRASCPLIYLSYKL